MNHSGPPVDAAEAQAQPRRRPPAIIILNQAAGSSAASTEVRERILSALASVGGAARLIELVPGRSLRETVERIADEAVASGATVVAAGGDGTISTVASACFLHGVPLGVVPLGTFNFFAREFGLPDDPAEAVRVALTGVPVPVDVGFVNARLFGHAEGAAVTLVGQQQAQRQVEQRQVVIARYQQLGHRRQTIHESRRRFALRGTRPLRDVAGDDDHVRP